MSPKRALAQTEYDFARKRFVQMMFSGDDLNRIVENASKRRAKLREEIENLRALAKIRLDVSREDAQNYKTVLPHRVSLTGMQAPGALEKIGAFHGSDRLYKRAVQSARDYMEARNLFIKKRDQLAQVEEHLRNQLHDREAAIERQLNAAGGHDIALKRDPLLQNAYKKLLALEADLAHPSLAADLS